MKDAYERTDNAAMANDAKEFFAALATLADEFETDYDDDTESETNELNFH